MTSAGKSWLDRVATFALPAAENRRFSDRLRIKTSRAADERSLRDEAYQFVRDYLGPFPNEAGYDPDAFDFPPDVQAVHMHHFAQAALEGLQETEAYAWGLAVTGVYHLWERSLKKALGAMGVDDPNLEQAGFHRLKAHVIDKGYNLTDDVGIVVIHHTCLIANTIKHGDGPACEDLKRFRPELFCRGKASGLRVGQREFDRAVEAIDGFWTGFEDATSTKRRRS